MALISLSELISNIRGSIGGTTFARNRAGLIAKRKSQGRKNYTAKQANIVKIQSFVVGQWQLLSLENQGLWNDYADLYEQVDKFGTTKLLSGFNWFCHVNNINYALNATIIEAPPDRIAATEMPTFTVNVSLDELSFTLDTPIDYPEETLYIFASGPVMDTNKTNRGNLRLIETLVDPDFTTHYITDEWSTAFGFDWDTITANSKFNIQIFLYTINNISFQNSVGVWSVGGFAPPVPWNPSNLNGLVAWFKGDAGITLNGADVSEWADQSGNGNDLTQATAADQGLFVDNAINSLPVVEFDGVSEYMQTADFNLVQPTTFCVLFKIDSSCPNYANIYNGLAMNTAGMETTSISVDSWRQISSSYFSDTKTISKSTWHLSIFAFNGSSSKWWLDSDAVDDGTIGTASPEGLTLAADKPQDQYFAGQIAEFFVTDNVIGDDDIDRIKTYINDRYATSF